MKLAQRLISFFLVVLMLSSAASLSLAYAEEQEIGKYPVDFDLSDLFASDDEWFTTYTATANLLKDFDSLRGTLNTADGILRMIETIADGDYRKNYEKLAAYQYLKYSLNSSDPISVEMNTKMSVLNSKYAQAVSFVDPEIFAMDLEARKTLFADPKLERYAYYLRNYTDENRVIHSEETLLALSETVLLYGRASNTYDTLRYVEMIYPEVTMPDGSKCTADEQLFNKVAGGDYSAETKKMVADAYFSTPASLINTYASLLNTSALEYVSNARIEGYDTVLEHLLHENDIDPEVYKNIKKSTYELLPSFQRYLKLVKEARGTNHMFYYDTLNPVSDFSYECSYDQACETMLQALGILGSDYTDEVRTILERGHVDVFPKENKDTGAFQLTSFNRDLYPYLLMNFQSDYSSLSTLCHEMGHALYARESEKNENNDLTNNSPTIFTHEVASITNEYLLRLHLLDEAKTDEEKLFYLESMLLLINLNVIRQMMYSEFEEYFYTEVENGSALSANALCNKWMELNRQYYGDDVEFPEGYEYRWSQIPHFFMGYYVFKYATSCTYAAAIAQKIINKERNAVDSYREFLTLGNSDKPEKLLTVAGVDPFNSKTYQYLLDFYDESVTRISELLQTE